MVGGFVVRLPTVRPLGKLSVRLLIVSGVTELALVMVICRTLFWPTPTVLGEKLLDNEIGELMVSFWLNAELVRPRVLPIAPALMELVKLCEVLVIEFTTTFTDNTQVPPEPVAPPIVPPVRVRDVFPGLGENVPFTAPVPVQLTLAAGVGATTMPMGRVSTNVVNGIVVPLLDGLVSVMVSVTGSPTSPGEGENDLLPVGGLRPSTDNVALASVVLVTVMTFSVA